MLAPADQLLVGPPFGQHKIAGRRAPLVRVAPYARKPATRVGHVEDLLWMLLKVGARFGVGPVMLLSFSSHPALASASAHIPDNRKRLIVLLWLLP